MARLMFFVKPDEFLKIIQCDEKVIKNIYFPDFIR